MVGQLGYQPASRRKAIVMKEGQHYSLNNDYLSPAQKTMVEMIWQFPFGASITLSRFLPY